jgi:hypothetical protein
MRGACRLGLLFAFLGALSSCRATQTLPDSSLDDVAGIRATIEELYTAFCFDAGAEPDWATQRRIYLEGAVFVPPLGKDRAPRVDDTEQFLTDFRAFAITRAAGFHERILWQEIDVFGGMAHAFVAFEGFIPGDGETLTRGLDSIQFVRDGATWRLVSFTTQYENDELSLP